MIRFRLGVEDLADTRFALSPINETLLSLRVLREPGLSALLLPWRRTALPALGGIDTGLLLSLVSAHRALPDFLTPRPGSFAPGFEEELDEVARTPADTVLRDLVAAHRPDPLPEPLRTAAAGGDAALLRLRGDLCDLLRRYWAAAIEPMWPQMRLVLEADMTYRARRLAVGGARALFADIHPDLHWDDGVLRIDAVFGGYTTAAAGRGLLLMPSVFAHKPAPPVLPEEPPALVYPSRGTATLWTPPPAPAAALVPLLGAPRARLLTLLGEPLPTVELARRLRVTPSAVSQHLRVLHAAGLVARARDGRHVLYRRSPLGEELTRTAGPPAPRT
ncbi:ArsR/SmtB family transcription factor [Nocardiopsis potens]|uniref:ArsR/SmtB family transcription factor n=1 Tax=Nocardiopsis potens TaxID=1246458 RepID=UPI0003465238|nr:helix-turn-helix domain-containing protein [Nocardiopsis potens]